MLLVCYDIANDKLRTQFSKFLLKYGRRVQYSVFEIDNSRRYIKLIQAEIVHKFAKKFTWSDTILVYQIQDNESKKVLRFGWAATEEEELLMFAG
jgi:CRISPR-associated protein Cas2